MSDVLGFIASIVVFIMVMSDSGSVFFSLFAAVVAAVAVMLLVNSVGAGGIVVGVVGVLALWWLFAHI